ncbi:MAG: glutathione S-transferase family protein [Sphingomonadales bacterium]|nr:glutathione S-transferase family protein [Sphingomonadales bacterium]
MSNLTLVSHPLCPYVQRAAIALTEKGVSFERIMIDLAAKPEWFKAISPLGKVPLLRVARAGRDDAILFESAVICEYIEETQAGTKLHPADPIERAQHRAWIEFASSILGDIYAIETTPDAALFERRREMLAEKFTRMESVLDAGPFFAGARFSLVDAAFGPAFRYFDILDGIADLGILANKPKVMAWRRALAERPSVRSAVAVDYPARLWQFLEKQDSHLRTLMQPSPVFSAAAVPTSRNRGEPGAASSGSIAAGA